MRQSLMASLLIVTGPPGAGKSTVAAPLADGVEPSVLMAGDDFFAFLARGAIPPWRPGSDAQNETVTEAAGAAAGRFAAGGGAPNYHGGVGARVLPTVAGGAGRTPATSWSTRRTPRTPSPTPSRPPGSSATWRTGWPDERPRDRGRSSRLRRRLGPARQREVDHRPAVGTGARPSARGQGHDQGGADVRHGRRGRRGLPGHRRGLGGGDVRRGRGRAPRRRDRLQPPPVACRRRPAPAAGPGHRGLLSLRPRGRHRPLSGTRGGAGRGPLRRCPYTGRAVARRRHGTRGGRVAADRGRHEPSRGPRWSGRLARAGDPIGVTPCRQGAAGRGEVGGGGVGGTASAGSRRAAAPRRARPIATAIA